MAMASSHFASAEKQFRFPLNYGTQRPLCAGWTVVGCGSAIIGGRSGIAKVTGATVGQLVDFGVKDSMNMGAAMAPAAAHTIRQHLEDFGRSVSDYDRIVTGDLGQVGSDLCRQLLEEMGISLGSNYTDCGLLLFDRQRQDVHAGGSGCGCSASVLCAHLLSLMEKGMFKRVLFCHTGALMSPTSSQQGESIPGICHAVCLTSE
jgi:stage V sporulation protein AD